MTIPVGVRPLAAGVLVGALLLPPGPSGSPSGPCEGPDADPWVVGAHQRVTSWDALFAFAVETFGDPVACEGEVDAEFDGQSFGTVELRFAGEVRFELVTMPPAMSGVSLVAGPDGFSDPDLVMETLKTYAEGRGLAVDWTTPERTRPDPFLGGETTSEQFWDPDTGLNASATLVWRDDRLVAVRVTMAP